MPFKSKAQQRYMFANHPRIAKRWADHTPDMKDLPERKKTAEEYVWEGFHKRLDELSKEANIGNPGAYPMATGPMAAPMSPLAGPKAGMKPMGMPNAGPKSAPVIGGAAPAATGPKGSGTGMK